MSSLIKLIIIVALPGAILAAIGLTILLATDNAKDDAPAPDPAATTGSDDAPMNLIELGAKLHIDHGCNACHGAQATMIKGPAYDEQWGTIVKLQNGDAITYDSEYVRMSLLNPAEHMRPGQPNMMPSYQGKLTNREIDAFALYIKSHTAAHRDETVEQARYELEAMTSD